ncbi:hypothetical protein LCGC14_1983010 [marine sediment metagenome]|uniref:Uncharacterized protein n=1 Tax=marine sediment metagenome TaxID=412755 RepID=A0A0F9I5E3_9ZZZZ
MGLMDILAWPFDAEGKEKTVKLEPMKEKFQMELGTTLSDLYKKYLPGYEPGKEYGDLSKLTTPSTFETQGLDYLQKYIGGGIKPTGVMGQAKDVLSKTLGGEFDPFESEYYESLRRNIEKERKQSMKKLDQMISKGGLGGTSYRAGRIGDITSESFDKISDVMALIQEQERINQLNAVSTAMDFSNVSEGQIQNKLATIMDIGSLPRLLEGVGYEDFLRKQGEFAGVPGLAQDLFKYDLPYGKKELSYREPSELDEFLRLAGNITSIVGNVIPETSPGGFTPYSSGAPVVGGAGGGGVQPGGVSSIPGVTAPAASRQPTVGYTTGGLNQTPRVSSLSLRAMSPSEFNQYWNQYS